MILDFSDTTVQLILLVSGVFVLWIGFLFLLVRLKKRKQTKKIKTATSYTLLQISLASSHTDVQRSSLEEVALFEEVVRTLVTDTHPIALEVAVANTSEDISFFIAVPSEYVETARSQIRRVFERAQIEEVPDYTIFSPESSSLLAHATLKSFHGLPIQTYKDMKVDTFASLVSVFSSARERGVGMALQLVLQKAPSATSRDMKAAAREVRSGTSLSKARPTSFSGSVSKTLSFFDTSSGSTPTTTPEESSEAQLIEQKALSPLYLTNVRIGICAENKEKAEFLFSSLTQQFDQFSTSGYNTMIFQRRSDRKMLLDFTFRLFNIKTATVFSTEEISSFFHLFTTSIEVSNLKFTAMKRIAAPVNLPSEGLLLGDNVFHGQQREIYISDEDRMRHLYIIGQTGTGKTALLKSLLYQDIINAKGACVIDPHGDLVDDLLSVIPEHRIDDVIVFDPSDLSQPVALNMLEYDRNRPEEKTFVVDEILSMFYRLFDKETMGPVFEQYMRNTLLLLMDGSDTTPAVLIDVPRVLTDASFRASLLERCSLAPVKQFWSEEAEKVGGEASLENIAPYITSKFANFISNDYIRPIISQPYSSFSFRDVMDSGKLLFVKLPQGRIGEINVGLLGMIVIGKLVLSALSRDDISESERRDYYLYLDEFQNFTTDSISKILSEARKYRLGLILAHQYSAQLTDSIRGAVLGNVGTAFSFRVGIEDAEKLEKTFAPQFNAKDLVALENLNAAVRMLSNNAPVDPFSLLIRFAPKGSSSLREKVVAYARAKQQSLKNS